jgi:phage terminase large subunit
VAFQLTTATKKLLKLNKRIRAISGGTSASKTISILMILIDYAQTHPGEIISVVSESYPHLKRGAMRDFINIMEAQGYFRDSQWNKSDSTYLFADNTVIEFFSVDQSEKVKGARRDVLFINEANNVSLEAFNQLEVRTRKIVWLDWNPVTEFWWYTDIAPTMDNQFLTLTYLDNEALEKAVVKSIESRKLNKNWWQVYGLGQLGEVEGRIYTGWNIIDSVPKFPESPRLWRYGMDFGYTNDPTAIIAIYEYNNGYILDEKVYQKGMRNKEIADTMKNFDRALTIADSAEPKSIDEIRSYGINIIPSEKGRDSIVHGITYIQDQKISVTKRSVNLIREYRNYMWQESRDGSRMENEPSDVLNHALDAIRYAIANKKAHKWVAPTDFGGVKPLFHGMPG